MTFICGAEFDCLHSYRGRKDYFARQATQNFQGRTCGWKGIGIWGRSRFCSQGVFWHHSLNSWIATKFWEDQMTSVPQFWFGDWLLRTPVLRKAILLIKRHWKQYWGFCNCFDGRICLFMTMCPLNESSRFIKIDSLTFGPLANELDKYSLLAWKSAVCRMDLTTHAFISIPNFLSFEDQQISQNTGENICPCPFHFAYNYCIWEGPLKSSCISHPLFIVFWLMKKIWSKPLSNQEVNLNGRNERCSAAYLKDCFDSW